MRLFQTALALGLGLLALVMYFFPLGPLAGLQWAFYDWAAVLMAAAWVLALVHMVQHHGRGLRRGRERAARAALLIALVSAFTVTLWAGPESPVGQWVVENTLLPAATSLFAVAGVVLTYRGLWLLQRRRDPLAWSFAAGVLLFLAADAVRFFTGQAWVGRSVQALHAWLVVPAMRGLLLGLALGLITTAWRLLIGVDRPYEDE